MDNPKIAIKGTFLFTAGILINLLLSGILFAGSCVLVKRQ
jgi:hypothetical protein